MIVATLLDLLLPEACVLCGRDCTHGLCRACGDGLPRVAGPCPDCGLPMVDAAHTRCDPPAGVDSVTAPFLFAPPVSVLIHRLKFGRSRSAGRALGLALVAAAGDALPSVDAWLAVPLHRSRLIERTFNQAEEIALALVRATGKPLLAGAVARSRATGPQAELPAATRRRNLEGAFTATRAIGPGRVGIVDDVVTTGATVSALAAALRAAGASAVDCVAVARAVPSGRQASSAP